MNIENIGDMDNEQLKDIYECNIKYADKPIDAVRDQSEEGEAQ